MFFFESQVNCTLTLCQNKTMSRWHSVTAINLPSDYSSPNLNYLVSFAINCNFAQITWHLEMSISKENESVSKLDNNGISLTLGDSYAWWGASLICIELVSCTWLRHVFHCYSECFWPFLFFSKNNSQLTD